MISYERRRKSGAEHDSFLSATQSDRARFIYSAAFRRLQQKAQVFSLESNSSVRSRLTHSIEVSHIGRYIVTQVMSKLINSKHINKEDKDFWTENSLALSNIVEIACLMHDVGNPPFGHFGEAAIQKWGCSDELTSALKESLNLEGDYKNQCDYLLDDFKRFDGNPQGFRVITRLQGEDGYYGLNLTYTQLASFLKYTYCPETLDKEKPFSKKIGYFSTEKKIIQDVWEKVKIPKHTRHPLGYLMEASDDISYCISDIEDGIEKKIISVEEFKNFTVNRLNDLKHDFPDDANLCEVLIGNLKSSHKNPISNFLSFKTKLSNILVERASQNFVENYYDFTSLKRSKVLIAKETFEYCLLKILKDFTSNNLFTSSEAECMELSGFSIIKGILFEYTKLLAISKEKFAYLVVKDNAEIAKMDLHIERRLFNRLPRKHVDAYKTSVLDIPTNDEKYSDISFLEKLKILDKEKEWNLRAHLIIDFVSGMTDVYSMDMYQMLRGIKVK
ncbi:dGTPase [Erwinia sp. B116]|uniref:dGTPase n=1 Tax=Erwinia sp. B116 TaxID=1561024 RepID=UPI000C762050|nr:dGTPase [Erwinia sp. B116]